MRDHGHKQTYAPEDRLGFRGEIVNSNVFSVSTWQHSRFASRCPQGRSVWRRCLCGGPNPVNPINNGATVPAHVPAVELRFGFAFLPSFLAHCFVTRLRRIHT